MTNCDVVKLADVGLTKPRSLAITKVGSPVYMAPEILLARGIYGRKADIYSLAIILWEMWYGIDAAEHIGQNLCGSFEKFIEEGSRPSLTLKHTLPKDWMALVQLAWAEGPNKRPEVDEILKFFETFLKTQ